MSRSPSKYALLIGINRYHESLGSLKYAVNDCKRLADVLTLGDDGFSPENVLLVTDDQPEDRRPTYANIHSCLASWLSQPKDDDTVLVYFCGHGRDMGGKCYLAPGDATLQTMHVTGIPVAYVQDLLGRCKARQKLLVLDACHSGAGRDVAAMSGSMLDQIASGKGIYTITACDADELSHEWDEKKQGVFSYYLAEALSGACPPDSQGRVTAESLYEWVYDRVRSWAIKKRCTQTPKRFAEGTGGLVLKTGGGVGGLTDTSETAQSIRPSLKAVDDTPAEAVSAVRHCRRSVRPYLITSAAILATIILARTLIDGSHRKAQAKAHLETLAAQVERGEFREALAIAPDSFGAHRNLAAELKQRAFALQEQAIERVLVASSDARHEEVVRLVESLWKDDIPPPISEAYAASQRVIDFAEAQKAADEGNSVLLFRLLGKYASDSNFLELRNMMVQKYDYPNLSDPPAGTTVLGESYAGYGFRIGSFFEGRIGRRVFAEGVIVDDLENDQNSVIARLDIQLKGIAPLDVRFVSSVDDIVRLQNAGMRRGARIGIRGVVTYATNARMKKSPLFGRHEPAVLGTMTIDPVEAWEIIRE